MSVYRVAAAEIGSRCDWNGCGALATCAEDTGGDDSPLCAEHCGSTHERLSGGAVVAHVHGGRSYWGRASECSACYVGRIHTNCH